MAPGLALPRHRHRAGYATIVLGGAFVEASFAGRFEVHPGDVLLHGRFDCHQNVATSRGGPQILRLPWTDDCREGLYRVDDADALIRLAERDPLEAMHALSQQLRRPSPPSAVHWCENLASELAAGSVSNLDAWSEEANLSPATLSRGFHRTFGATPKLFRLEARTRRAWQAVVGSTQSLTAIAQDFGFADLPHMSRSIHRFTGMAPSGWRRSSPVDCMRPWLPPPINCVQAAGARNC